MRLQDDVLYLMSLVLHRHFDGMSRDFLKQDLGRSEWRCLAVLTERDGCIVSELTDLTQQPQTTISRVIARMERDGLVSRRQRPGDGRFIELRITPKGRAKLEKILPTVDRQHRAALDGLTQAELDSLRTLLRKMLGGLAGARPMPDLEVPAPARANRRNRAPRNLA